MSTEPKHQFFTPEQRELAKRLFCKELSADEAEQFLTICERTGLDPFTRQIYARAQSINRAKQGQPPKWEKTLVVITGIDGLRSLAEKTGQYRGQTKPEWFYQDGSGEPQWHDHWLGLSRGNNLKVPEAARVGVYREKFVEALYAVATYESFVQYGGQGADKGPTQFWRKMPDIQLLKCAEAQALRKAFPLVLSGLFIEEEVQETELSDEERAAIEAERQKKLAETEPKKVKPSKPKPENPVPKEARADFQAPEPDPVPEPEIHPIGAEDYVISTIKHEKYAGKTLAEIGVKALVNLKAAFYDKNKEKIEADPKTSAEWKKILLYIESSEPELIA